ncbi:hypothetical protein BDA99DRAFT_511044 [Phascolomyces articulosus]|uniref:RNA-binding protein n=1 Tax=Phascolomyces articulosus TaxID=60185 RepID=A0AAD5KD16_9FUNG|nr:hypothetical protein BDA99DRAFT_511044 [Phascolomyces articulosus]
MSHNNRSPPVQKYERSPRHRSRSPNNHRSRYYHSPSPPPPSSSRYNNNKRQYSRHDDRDDYHSNHNRHHHQRDRRRRHERRYEDQDYYQEDKHPTEPNINVVLRSLPDRARERDIHKTLESMGASVDEVSLIRDRDTGESRKFAFVRFTSVGHAVQFVEKHYPHFHMNHHRVRVDYCNKEGTREDLMEWRCLKCGKFNDDSRRVCIECRTPFEGSKAEKRSKETESMDINDGTMDVTYTPTHMLLLRNLDHLSSEESIFHALQSMSGLRRVLLIKDKLTRMSCEFAFVEFFTVQDAMNTMTHMNKSPFRIDGSQPTISFASLDSFLPAYASSEWAIPADSEEGLWIYRDGQAYAAEYSIQIQYEREEKKNEEKRMADERKAKEEQEKKERAIKQQQAKKDSLEDDLSAFYAGMGDILSSNDKNDDTKTDIFSVPKV